MAIRAHVMSGGGSPQEAGAIVGGWVTQAVAGNASTNATLMSISSNYQITTSSSNQGCIFPPGNGTADSMNAGDHGIIFNNTTNSIIVYPPAGFKINGGSANAGVTLTTLQKALWNCIDGQNFVMLVG